MEEKLKRPIVIDTDPGDDDAASIMWIIASDMFEIKALTITHGNVGLDKCAINALRTLEVCKRTDIPVYKGAWKPLVFPILDASWIHGEDGLGDAGFPLPRSTVAEGFAPVKMVEIARQSVEPITILALGPITNIALAVLLDEEFASHVKEIVFMGGAVRVPGNTSPGASFNVAVDPHAAQIVYESGIPIVQVGLDVCNQVTQRWTDLDEIATNGHSASNFLVRMMDYRRRAVKIVRNDKGDIVREIKASDQADRLESGIGLNDLTTTAYLINPDWFKGHHISMAIDTVGISPGRTVADFEGLWGKEANCLFIDEVEKEELIMRWVRDMKVFQP